MSDVPSSSDLRIKLTLDERRLLEAAATRSSTSLGDFMRRQALEAAELEASDRRIVTIPAEDWVKFEAWLTSPGKAVSALQDLLRRPLSWER